MRPNNSFAAWARECEDGNDKTQASARDVANLVVFLASDQANYITGALIDTSGGKLVVQMPQVAYEYAKEEGGSSHET